MNELLKNETEISRFETWEQASEAKRSQIWKSLENISVQTAIDMWIQTYKTKPHTQKAYRLGMKRLSEYGLIRLDSSLQAFSLVNHDAIIDQIKLVDDWKERSRQARAACYISFTGFLARRTGGLIRKAIPSKEESTKTFFRVKQKVSTFAMSRKQWGDFFAVLEKDNPRDALIGKLMLQGGKRVSEVLSLRIENINWEEREIEFTQAKTKGEEIKLLITYPQHILDQLKDLIGERTEGLVFLTRNEKRVHAGQIERSFARSGRKAGISLKVTPHVMRASLVTYLKDNGFADSEIIKITGHHSAAMVAAYDKTEQKNNPTKEVDLV